MGQTAAMCGVGLAVGRQPSKLIYTGSIPVPRFSQSFARGLVENNPR
jgi:hypothetical protein